MRYIHLSQWSPRNSFGGYETIVRDTALGQRKKNHTVYVIGRVEGAAKVQTISVDGVTYIEISSPLKRRPSSLDVGASGIIMLFVEIIASLWLLTPQVLRVLKKEKIDAVIFYGIHLMLMGPVVRLAGSKALLGLEVLQKNQKVAHTTFLYWLRRLKYACFDGIFTYTSFFYLDGKKFNNIALLKMYAPHTPVAYIPWGIDVPATRKITADTALSAWKRKTHAVVILIPRRLVEEKGVRYVLEAVPRIVQKIPHAYIIFAGDGILRADMERRVDELGVRAHIRFTGFMSHLKTLQTMKVSDMIVVPSSGEESFGMVFLEAYALGVPIVSTTFGGIPNVVKDARSGILVPPKNTHELAEAIIQMAHDSIKRKRYVDEGKRLVESEFTIQKTLDRIDKFTNSL